MTKEQTIKHLKLMQSGARNAIRFSKNDKKISDEERKEDIEIYQDQLEALEMAIKALEQLCEDCVSRKQAKIDIIPNSLYTSEQVIAILDNLSPVIPTFPKDSTNGDIVTAMFPDIKIHEHEKTDICDAYIQIDIWDFSICVSKDWWGEPYTEKRGSEE